MTRRRTASNGSDATTSGVTIALIYSRVSSDEQADEGNSLDAQLSECRRYVAMRGWIIGDELTDIMSGKIDSRPQYVALLAQVRELRAQGRTVAVVVAALDRFGRRLLERVRARQELAGLGVATHSLREGGEVSDLTANILASVAEEEVERLGQRMRVAWTNLAELGWYKISPALPWGYRTRPATEDERRPARFGGSGSPATVLEIDELAAPYVREAFQRVAEGQSTFSVAKWLASLPEDIRGIRWNDAEKKKNGKPKPQRKIVRLISWRTMQEILRNPVYCGEIEFNASVEKKAENRWKNPVWKRVPANHEAIVDREVFDKVQRRLDAYRDAPRAQPERYPLTGFLFCPSCGARMAGSTVSVGRRRLKRYRCSNSLRIDGNNCSETADAVVIEALVFDKVSSIIRRATAMPDARKRFERGWAKLSKPDATDTQAREIERLEKQAKEAHQYIRDATDMRVRGEIAQPYYMDRVSAQEAVIASAQAEANRLREQMQEVPALPSIDVVLSALASWGSQRPAVLALLIERVIPHRVRRGKYVVNIEWTRVGAALS